MNPQTYATLITAQQLMELQQAARPVMVFDCSFDLTDPGAGEALYALGHIPGAAYVHLDRDLSASHDAQDAASGGRHPLPSRDVFVQRMRALGLNKDVQAVVYDRQGANHCGRLWWMLKWCGHEAVAVLDGGVNAWTAAGGELEAGPLKKAAAAGNLELGEPKVRLISAQEVCDSLGRPSQTIVDARATPRFRGEVEPLDPVAGHIPGALNRPFTENFLPSGHFKPAAQLRAELEAVLGGRPADTVVHQCGSGVSAVPNLLAMELAGLGRTALFAGSWSEWCRTPGLPCARG
jgi:thiosulfate/3-mercaptopyruvate sulfurtransferase